MSSLSNLLQRVREASDYRRARILAANDYRLLADLVAVRKSRGLKQSDVAAALGITQQAVSKIESHDSDPKLSTLRLYANAVGALVAHVVEADHGQLDNGRSWTAISYTTPSRSNVDSAPAPMSYVTKPARKATFALSA